MKATHLIIAGQVQGVGYRDWLVVQARSLGLAGWVRNVGESVEALIAGDAAAVEECCRACRRGPKHAAVESIVERLAEPPAEPGFVKRASLPTF